MSHKSPPFGDLLLEPYRKAIEVRLSSADSFEKKLTGARVSLADFASGHEYFGLHRRKSNWSFAEWAPNAEKIYLVGDFNGWSETKDYELKRLNDQGIWELKLPHGALSHRQHYMLRLRWPGGAGERIPAYARRVVQDASTGLFCAQVWDPEAPYIWQNSPPKRRGDSLLVYEAHVGMAQEREGVGTYEEFRRLIMPRIVRTGYDTLQLMALMEHPYYGSFGYQVSNFFAASSRFGTPEELKALIDEAHGMGLRVIMDLVHSHGVRNEVEGLGRFDGTRSQYFHEGERGVHPLWDSYLFDYAKPEVAHFLLSNCRFWLDEYRLDGFRFDGVTSMIFSHHGINHDFGHYDEYFGPEVDEEALTYLSLANKVVHSVRPDAVTIAEDVSGMPGLSAPIALGGAGFDFRMGMGVSDCWFKLTDLPDEEWNLGWLWHELNNRRIEERTVSYVECHDQALVGGKSMIFTLADAAMYHHMGRDDQNLEVNRAIALVKLMRLSTLATAQAYLNFMGNEFGHPEWVDFPREANGWSYRYARRQWSLADDEKLKYGLLSLFDGDILKLLSNAKGFFEARPVLIKLDDQNGVLIFKRGSLVFALNFHPEKSQVGYSFDVEPGNYQLLLNSDDKLYGGAGRVDSQQSYPVAAQKGADYRQSHVQVYLPCRTALVIGITETK